MKRGDIYMVSLDPTSGKEQKGSRPVLVISHTAFNQRTKTVIALPITRGGEFARNAGFAVSLASLGLKTDGVVLCSQPRTLDLHARAGVFVESVPNEILDEVIARLIPILQ